MEVSEDISTEGDIEAGVVQISGERRLLSIVDIGAELRLFACACSARVLDLYERIYPGDDRPRRAIRIAREYARGRVTASELRSAFILARDVADAAPAGSAARCAAMAASGCVADEPQDGAMLAIWGAGWAADGKDAAGGAERVWQRALFARMIERRVGSLTA